jgi:transcriptional regulator with XRE-family HTH domain
MPSQYDPRKVRFMEMVGERIRIARESAGIGMRELAKQAGIGLGTLQNAENGSTCSLYVLVLIAEHLDGVTLDDLVPVLA